MYFLGLLTYSLMNPEWLAVFWASFCPQCILARMSVVTTILQQSFKIDCRHFLFFPQPATTNYSRSGPSFPLLFQKFFIGTNRILYSLVFRYGPDHLLILITSIINAHLESLKMDYQKYKYIHNWNLKYQLHFLVQKRPLCKIIKCFSKVCIENKIKINEKMILWKNIATDWGLNHRPAKWLHLNPGSLAH